MRPPAGGSAGFSLVEMLVVLVVLGLAAAIGLPAIGSILPARALAALGDAIGDELNRLRAEALRTGSPARLVFEAEGRRFVSSRAGAQPIAAGDVAVVLDRPPGARSEPGEIRFLPGGGSTGGRIAIANASGSRAITVVRATGAVRSSEAPP